MYVDPAAVSPLFALILLTGVRCCGLIWTAPLLSGPYLTTRLKLGLAVLLGTCGALAAAPASRGLSDHWTALAWHLPLEFTLGAALGAAVRVLMSGIELAAGIIDQQSGLALGAVLHPAGDGETSPGGAWLVLLSGMTWLTLAPLGGDLRLFAAWLDTLRALPPGSLTTIDSPVRLVHDVVLAALMLGLQIALPVIVTLGLLQSLWAVLARARGGPLQQPALGPVRCGVCLLVLAATTTDIGTRVSSGVDGVLRSAVGVLSFRQAER